MCFCLSLYLYGSHKLIPIENRIEAQEGLFVSLCVGCKVFAHLQTLVEKNNTL